MIYYRQSASIRGFPCPGSERIFDSRQINLQLSFLRSPLSVFRLSHCGGRGGGSKIWGVIDVTQKLQLPSSIIPRHEVHPIAARCGTTSPAICTVNVVAVKIIKPSYKTFTEMSVIFTNASVPQDCKGVLFGVQRNSESVLHATSRAMWRLQQKPWIYITLA